MPWGQTHRCRRAAGTPVRLGGRKDIVSAHRYALTCRHPIPFLWRRAPRAPDTLEGHDVGCSTSAYPQPSLMLRAQAEMGCLVRSGFASAVDVETDVVRVGPTAGAFAPGIGPEVCHDPHLLGSAGSAHSYHYSNRARIHSSPTIVRPVVKAHITTAARSQIRPEASSATGSGNPLDRVSWSTRCRLTPKSEAISADPTSSEGTRESYP